MKILIGIAGRTASGKTTLANGLAKQLDADLLSFGEYVRGLASSTNLQSFGQQLVNQDVNSFVDGLLANARDFSRPVLIVEGIRHVSVWKRLQEHCPKNILVVLYPGEQMLIDKLIGRGLSRETAANHLAHPVESEMSLLKEVANVVLSHEEAQERVNIVRAYLENHKWE